jgi:hypothetical protein
MSEIPPLGDLQKMVDQAWSSERPHVERLTLVAAVISTALEREGMRPTLVGGGAVEFYAPGAYVTEDIDFVVEGRTRDAIDGVLRGLGFERRGRHWARKDLFVEVPASHLEDAADEYDIGPFRLRVIRKEHILGERMVGFRFWKSSAHAQQAIDLLAALGDELAEDELRTYLRREGAEDVLALLRDLTESGGPISAQTLDELWRHHYG